MGVSGIIAIISLVFSTLFGISGFVISLINLILGIKKNKSEKKSADKNSKILEQKNEILATDSKNRAEHFKNEERLKEQNNAIWEKTAQKIYDFLEKNSKSIIVEEPKKELISTDDEHFPSEYNSGKEINGVDEMKKTVQFSAYQYFLADIFADTQKEWAPYTNNVALRFLLKYNENLDYLIEKMNDFVKNRDSLIAAEINQMKIILNLTSLRELLKFNDSTKEVDIDYQKIDAIFFEIKDQEEIIEFTEAIETLENDKTTNKTNSFAELGV